MPPLGLRKYRIRKNSSGRHSTRAGASMPHRPASEATRCTFGRGDRSGRAPLPLQPHTPAPRPTGEDVRVVEETIKHRDGGGRIAEAACPSPPRGGSR
jgi:hypothetical protein